MDDDGMYVTHVRCADRYRISICVCVFSVYSAYSACSTSLWGVVVSNLCDACLSRTYQKDRVLYIKQQKIVKINLVLVHLLLSLLTRPEFIFLVLFRLLKELILIKIGLTTKNTQKMVTLCTQGAQCTLPENEITCLMCHFFLLLLAPRLTSWLLVFVYFLHFKCHLYRDFFY